QPCPATVRAQRATPLPAGAPASVTVADATLSATANAITAWPNQGTGLVAGATFTDPNSAAPTGDFSASVSWGDGSSVSSGTVLPTPGGSAGQFPVYGPHTWTTP